MQRAMKNKWLMMFADCTGEEILMTATMMMGADFNRMQQVWDWSKHYAPRFKLILCIYWFYI